MIGQGSAGHADSECYLLATDHRLAYRLVVMSGRFTVSNALELWAEPYTLLTMTEYKPAWVASTFERTRLWLVWPDKGEPDKSH